MNEPIMQFFAYEMLPEHILRIAKPFAELARSIVAEDGVTDEHGVERLHLPRNAERTVALQKLLEAKDAAVRSAWARRHEARRAIKVRELIKTLSKLPQEMAVSTWNAEEDDYVPITGAIWEDGHTTVDLMTDCEEP